MAGIDGLSASNAHNLRFDCIHDRTPRCPPIRGGGAAANALRTVFLEILSLLAITLIGMPSAR